MRANRGRGPLLHWPCISESSGISDLTLWLGLYSGINSYSYSARPLLPEQGAGGIILPPRPTTSFSAWD